MPLLKLGSHPRIHSTSHENRSLPTQISYHLHSRIRYDPYVTLLFSLLRCSPSFVTLLIQLCFMVFVLVLFNKSCKIGYLRKASASFLLEMQFLQEQILSSVTLA